MQEFRTAGRRNELCTATGVLNCYEWLAFEVQYSDGRRLHTAAGDKVPTELQKDILELS